MIIAYFNRRVSVERANSFKTLDEAVKAYYNANAGKPEGAEIKDSTGGYAKAVARAGGFYEHVKKYGGASAFFQE